MQIVMLADELIRKSGYHSFSYADIAKPLGVKNAAIHYHFPSKADLGLAVINNTREDFKKQTDDWQDLEPIQQLKAFSSMYTKIGERSLVCFMGALGPSYSSLPKIMQASLTNASNEIRTWVQSLLKKGKQVGVFTFSSTAEEQADLIVSCLLASLILNRVTGDQLLTSNIDLLLKNITK